MNQRDFSPEQLVLFQQALALHSSGQLSQAGELYQSLLSSVPENSQLLAAAGTLALQLGNAEGALRFIGQSLAIDPAQPAMLSNFGIALQSLRRLDEALASFDLAITLNPAYAEAHNNRGNVLKDLRRLEDALSSYGKAVVLKPDYAEAFYNLGLVLHDMGRLEEALENYDLALSINPDYAEVCSNRGNVLKDLNRLHEALASYDRAIELRPDYASALWNKSLVKLLKGDFEAGWKLYEWRWKDSGKGDGQHFLQPLWLGDGDISGKTLLIHAEQGLGDIIQFCRYVPIINKMGARVVLDAPAPLAKLCSTMEADLIVVESGKPLPHFDTHCPIMSLPLACRTVVANIPADIPYLRVDEQRREAWRKRLGPKTKPRVGLAWSGSSAHHNDRNRSIPLRLMQPVLQLPFEFHGVQKEVKVADLMHMGSIHMHQDELFDFSDTAALMSEMDLVVSVDTSAAHLAGALGLPVWILLPYASDFRWLFGRDDSPWYPTAKLYRQLAINGWEQVVSQVCGDMSTYF